MYKFFILILLKLSIAHQAQKYEQLIRYADFHQKSIKTFTDFIGIAPTISEKGSGIHQLVFEFESHSIGVEGKVGNSGNIHEIYVFQTGFQNGHHYFTDIFLNLQKENSLQFVKGIFDDGLIKENNLALHEFQSLTKNFRQNERTNYAVRYRKGKTFITAAVLRNKLVFTIDDKNH